MVAHLSSLAGHFDAGSTLTFIPEPEPAAGK